MSPQLEIQLIAVVVAVAAALPGTYLVLRRLALVSDALTHAVLPGIVIAFLIVRDLTSPFLVVGAAASGLAMAALIAALQRTGLIKEDAATALAFPALVSVAVIVLAVYARRVHLDTHVVLLGELAFAPFHRWVVAGVDLGPKALWSMGSILLANAGLIALAYKELKLSTFDPPLAAALGLAPAAIHYGLMAMVSVTVVGAFNAVGFILVITLMIAPPATAYLLVNRLEHMLLLGGAIGAASAVSGYWLARLLDASISGAMATMAGVCFMAAMVLAPDRGLLAQTRKRARWRQALADRTLLVHLLHHQAGPASGEEAHLDHLPRHLRWTPEVAQRVARRLEEQGLLVRQGRQLALSSAGDEAARAALSDLPMHISNGPM
jgi:manganese/zinc/iron transport system permease protein